jgi:phospholipid N-methyltransferase
MSMTNDTTAATKPLVGNFRFLRAFLLNFEQTGGIVPSQRFLVSKMIAPVPTDYRGQIIELGPGNGAITLRLAARCPQARILACEINPSLARATRTNIARSGLSHRVKVAVDSAEHLLPELGSRGVPKADFILSGIPLANLGRPQTHRLLDVIHDALADGGMYVQFQYSLVDRKKIKARFRKLRTVPALLNFPPALVYYAWK